MQAEELAIKDSMFAAIRIKREIKVVSMWTEV